MTRLLPYYLPPPEHAAVSGGTVWAYSDRAHLRRLAEGMVIGLARVGPAVSGAVWGLEDLGIHDTDAIARSALGLIPRCEGDV